MIRQRVILAAVLAIGLVGFGWSLGQESKTGKSRLPPGWSKLNLTEEQKKKVYGISIEYKKKLDAIKIQMEKTKAAEKAEMIKVLTKEQKTKLRELQEGGEGEKSEDKK